MFWLERKTRKKKIIKKKPNEVFNPYKQGKIQLTKKKMKEGLDNKIDQNYLISKIRKRKTESDEYFEEEEEDEETKEYNLKKRYYEQMLGEDGIKNLEDLKDLNIITKQEQENKDVHQPEEEKKGNEEQPLLLTDQCPICSNIVNQSGSTLLKKKENPALFAPGQINNGFVCCLHHSKEYFTTEDKNPKNFNSMPPCMLASVIPAGRPTKKNEPLNLFK